MLQAEGCILTSCVHCLDQSCSLCSMLGVESRPDSNLVTCSMCRMHTLLWGLSAGRSSILDH